MHTNLWILLFCRMVYGCGGSIAVSAPLLPTQENIPMCCAAWKCIFVVEISHIIISNSPLVLITVNGSVSPESFFKIATIVPEHPYHAEDSAKVQSCQT